MYSDGFRTTLEDVTEDCAQGHYYEGEALHDWEMETITWFCIDCDTEVTKFKEEHYD